MRGLGLRGASAQGGWRSECSQARRCLTPPPPPPSTPQQLADLALPSLGALGSVAVSSEHDWAGEGVVVCCRCRRNTMHACTCVLMSAMHIRPPGSVLAAPAQALDASESLVA